MRKYSEGFVQNLIDSFNFAVNGIISSVKRERNMKITPISKFPQ